MDLNTAVSEEEYNLAINHASISSFQATPTIEDKSIMINNEFSAFAYDLNTQAETSKMSVRLGSTTAYIHNNNDLFYNEPIYADVEDFKVHIDATLASRPQTVSLEFLSKIW